MINIHTKLHTMFCISTAVHIDNKSKRQWHIWHNTNYSTPPFSKLEGKCLCTWHFLPTSYGVLSTYCPQYIKFSPYPILNFTEPSDFVHVTFPLFLMKFYSTICLCTCMFKCFCFYTIRTLLKQLFIEKKPYSHISHFLQIFLKALYKCTAINN